MTAAPFTETHRETCQHTTIVQVLSGQIVCRKCGQEFVPVNRSEWATKVFAEFSDKYRAALAEIDRLHDYERRALTDATRAIDHRDVLATRLVLAEDALSSIAGNSCCTPCQEAKLVAQKALRDLFGISHPERGPTL